MKERRIEILGILLVTVSLLILISFFGYNSNEDPGISPNVKIENPLGILGLWISYFFIKLGCNKIVINTHYLHNEIKIFVEKKFSNQNIKLIFEPELLNTGGGIKNALSYFDNKNFLIFCYRVLQTCVRLLIKRVRRACKTRKTAEV